MSHLTTLLAIGERPAFVLALLHQCGQALTQTTLEMHTKWSANTISKAMAVLKHHGLAVQGRDRGPWAITMAGKALFESNDSSTVEGSPNLGPEGPEGLRVSPQAIGETNGLLLPASTFKTFNLKVRHPSTVEGTNLGFPHAVRNRTGRSSTVEGSNGRSSSGEESNLGSIPQPLRNDGNGHGPNLPDMEWVLQDHRRVMRMAACRECDIQPPALTEFVNNEAIDAIYILAHAWQVNKQNQDRKDGEKLKPGAAVWRIRNYHSPSKEAIQAAERRLADYRQCNQCGLGYFLQEYGGWVVANDQPCPHCGLGPQADEEPTHAPD